MIASYPFNLRLTISMIVSAVQMMTAEWIRNSSILKNGIILRREIYPQLSAITESSLVTLVMITITSTPLNGNQSYGNSWAKVRHYSVLTPHKLYPFSGDKSYVYPGLIFT